MLIYPRFTTSYSYHIFEFARYYKKSGHKKDPSPEFQSFAIAQLEILPSPTGGEGTVTPGVLHTLPLWEGRNL